MKKIILFVAVVILVFGIYIQSIDNKIYYVSLGDGYAVGYNNYVKDYINSNHKLKKYVDVFVDKNNRTIDIINDIENNNVEYNNGEKLYMKQVLIKADLVTLSVGYNDFLNVNKTDVDLVNDVLSDFEKLLMVLRKNCKEKIVVVDFNQGSVINERYKDICSKYDVLYIDVENNYFPGNVAKSEYADIGKKVTNLLNC